MRSAGGHVSLAAGSVDRGLGGGFTLPVFLPLLWVADNFKATFLSVSASSTVATLQVSFVLHVTPG